MGIDESSFETFWEELLADAEAIAAEYRDRDWEVHSLTPGDVTTVVDADSPDGLSVLVPNPEFELVADLQDSTSFDESDVYRRTAGPVVFLLLVERSSADRTAVLIPAYYNHVADADLLSNARDSGELLVHVRALGTDERILFSHDDPSLFVPDDEGTESEPSDTATESGSADGETGPD